MVKLIYRFSLLSSIYVISLFRYSESLPLENSPYDATSGNAKLNTNEQDVMAEDTMKMESTHINLDEKNGSQYPEDYYNLNRMKGLRNNDQLSQRISAERKYLHGNLADLYYRQPDRAPKERMDQQDYRSAKIKESETAEKNLKKLLKILNENMFFQTGGIPQPRNRDQTRKKFPNQDNDELDEAAQQELQVSYPKSLSPDCKDFPVNKQNDLVKEILRKEYKRILKSKDNRQR